MSLRPKFNMLQLSDTGKVREHNEDAIGTNLDAGLLVALRFARYLNWYHRPASAKRAMPPTLKPA